MNPLGDIKPISQPIVEKQGESNLNETDELVQTQRSKMESKQPGEVQSKPIVATQVQIDTEGCSEKSGHMWDCISRTPCEAGGYIYKFQLKDEYDVVTDHDKAEERQENFNKKRAEIAPAVEIEGKELLTRFSGNHLAYEHIFKSVADENKDVIDRGLIEKAEDEAVKQFDSFLGILNQVGYVVTGGNKGVFITLPDKQALEGLWEKLREKHPNLLPLRIQDSEGIAGDMEYVEATLNYEAILSKEKEFVHDHTAHIINIVEARIKALQSPDQVAAFAKYSKGREKITNMIKKEYDYVQTVRAGINDTRVVIDRDPEKDRDMRTKLLNQIEMLEFCLGAVADGFNAVHFPDFIESVDPNRIKDYLSGSPYGRGFAPVREKRFGQAEFLKVIDGLRTTADKIFEQYNNLKQNSKE